MHASHDDLDTRLAALERRLGAAGTGADTSTSPASSARIGAVALRIPAGASFDDVWPRRLAYREDEPFPSASTIKVFILQALLEEVAAGRVRLEDERRVHASDMVTGSGVLKALTPGRAYPLVDLATLMIAISDNTATNVLIDLLGIERVRATIARHGWSCTQAMGKLQLGAVQAGRKPSPSTTSAADLADYFTRLWLGDLLPPELTDVAKSIYRKQQFGELGRSLDYDGYSAEIGVSDLRIASKSGSIRGVRNDAGVFEHAPFDASAPVVVMAVMTRGCPDERFHPDNLGAKVLGEAAALLYHASTDDAMTTR